MSLLKTVIGLTKVYLDANNKCMVNVQIHDECYNVSIIYEGLDMIEDEYFIHLGESGNESSDVSIVKNKIATMGIDDGNIIIELIDGKKFIVTIDTECEVENSMYRFDSTD